MSEITKIFLRKQISAGLVIFVMLAIIVADIFMPGLARAAGPSVYLSPSSQALPGNVNLVVKIRENSGTTPVNAIQANLSYPTSLLTLSSIDYTGTAFGTAVQSSGSGGVIKIARGTPCSTTCTTVTGDKLVATLNFKTTTTSNGHASVVFTSGTALVSASSNTDILGGLAATTGGDYINTKLIGDFNDDCTVNFLDFSFFLKHYNLDANGDLNGDSVTNFLDFSAFLKNYNTSSTGCN